MKFLDLTLLACLRLAIANKDVFLRFSDESSFKNSKLLEDIAALFFLVQKDLNGYEGRNTFVRNMIYSWKAENDEASYSLEVKDYMSPLRNTLLFMPNSCKDQEQGPTEQDMALSTPTKTSETTPQSLTIHIQHAQQICPVEASRPSSGNDQPIHQISPAISMVPTQLAHAFSEQARQYFLLHAKEEQAKWENELNGLKAENTELKDDMDLICDENNSLRDQNTSLDVQKFAFKEKLEEAERERTCANEERAAVQASLMESERKRQDLERERKELERQVEELQTKVLEKEKEKQSLKRKLETAFEENGKAVERAVKFAKAEVLARISQAVKDEEEP